MKRFLILAFFLAAGLAAQAQEDNSHPHHRRHDQAHHPAERIESAKAAMITTRLNLSTEQSKAFWPIYNEFSQKRQAIRKEMKGLRQGEATTEAEAKARLNRLMIMRQQEVELEKEYNNKLLEVISARQMLTLIDVEREFMRMLINRLEKPN